MTFSPDDMNTWTGSGIAFTCGVVLHTAIFRRGEWDTHSKRLIIATTFLYGAVTGLAVATYGFIDNDDRYDDVPFATTLRTAASTVGIMLISVLVGLFSSILIYRTFFHPLRHFPGPFGARLSNAYQTWLYCRSWRLDVEVQKLHRVYGDVVRVGPRELSINDPESLHAFHSSTSPCLKGPWYSYMAPASSLQTARDPVDHTERRKAWDLGFSSKCRFFL